MLKKIYIPIFAISLCAGCVPLTSSSGPSLEEKVQQQDIQLRQMQSQQADTWNQLQAMKQENETLRGQLDDLNNVGGAKAIADRVRQHDAALRQVDNNMALNLELGTPMGSASPAPAYAPSIPQAQTGTDIQGMAQGVPMTGMGGLKLTGAPDSSAYGSARTVPQPPAAVSPTIAPPVTPQTGSYGLPPEPVQNTIVQTEEPSSSTWGQADPRPQQLEVAKKDISLALFDAGVNSYNARDYGAAERSFSDFLKNYPKHSQTAEAQYYLAECDFQRNRFPEAALAFDTVIKKYPKSSSAPAAYFQQAICFSKMKQPAAAKARMQEIISKFPKSAEAARAKTFLKTNK